MIMPNTFKTDDGSDVGTYVELQETNNFFEIMDGCEVPGSIYGMIGNVDVDKLRTIPIPSDLERSIKFYQQNAAMITIYCESIRSFVASRTMRGHMYIRGLNDDDRLIEDRDIVGLDYYISLWVDDLDLPIEKEGTEIHPKVKKQIVALTIASKIAETVGKPYRRYFEGQEWDHETMSPARLLDLSLSEQEVIEQIREALYVSKEI